MKKAASFFFTFLPPLLALGLEFAAVFFAMGISALCEGLWYAASGRASFSEIYTDLIVLWNTERFNTGIMILFSVSCAAIFGVWYYSRYESAVFPRPSKAFHPLSLLGIVLLTPAAQFLTSVLINLAALAFPSWLKAYAELMERAGISGKLTFGILCYSVLLAPLSEELIFRGVTLRQARRTLPFWAANLLQAALFGAFHMNMLQGIYAFCLGLLLGYLCEKSGGIHHSVLLHVLYNFYGTTLSGLLPFQSTPRNVAAAFFLSVAAAFLGLSFFRLGTASLRRESTGTV